MKTPVYVKVDMPDQLLLGEGVWRQLAIWNRGRTRQPPPEEWDILHQQETMQRRGPSLNKSQTDRRGGRQPETHVGPYNKTQPETHENDSNRRRTAGGTQHAEGET